MKIAVIGAGSTYTPELADGLIRRTISLPVSELVLMDIDARKLDIVGRLIQRMAAHAGVGFSVRMTMDLDDALRGSAFVMAQIRVGQLPARLLDERIPLAHGLIGQETTGIGGMLNALRTIPVMTHIARRMEALCPDAWLINFSNPSGLVAEALLRHTRVKMLGLCNIPVTMRSAIRKELNDPNASVESVGLNHLSWITSVFSRGEERLQDLIDVGFTGERGVPSFDACCMRAAGGIPNSYLSYYYHRSEKLRALQEQPRTRAAVCMGIEEELLKQYNDDSLFTKPALLDERGGHLYSEAAVSLADSIWNDRGDVQVVNAQNRGALNCLEPDEVAELPFKIGKGGATPVPLRSTGTPHMHALIRSVKAFERITVEVAYSGDRDMAISALFTHPLTREYTNASRCFDELVCAHKAYLPQFEVRG
jgi:6-phospho-beta-glucosidase